MTALLTIGGQVENYAPDVADQSYAFPVAGLIPETTQISAPANSANYMPCVGEYETLIPVAEGISTRIIPTPDPAVGGHQGDGNMLTYRTGLRETRWITQSFNGQTVAVPMSRVNPPGVVGHKPFGDRLILSSDAALAGDPSQTPLQNAELYASGLPTSGVDPNYG